jgi:hypothetical protein
MITFHPLIVIFAPNFQIPYHSTTTVVIDTPSMQKAQFQEKYQSPAYDFQARHDNKE